MLTNTTLKNLKPRDKAYKVPDRDGMYVTVSTKATVAFRYDYRFNSRRETLTIGQYDEHQAAQIERNPTDLQYGMALSLAEARTLLARAKATVKNGISPAREKADGKKDKRESGTFKTFTDIWLRDAGLADSTLEMKKSILDRDILPTFGNRLLEEINPSQLMALCEKIKERGAPATAVHAREIVHNVYRQAQKRGLKIENPADKIKASAIATFKPRERTLTPFEIKLFYTTLDRIGSIPQVKLALKFVLLTMCRKSELLQAKWPEIDFQAETWTVPAERMKARRAHVVYLSHQTMDLLIALKTCAGSIPYILPGRYETDQPMSEPALNRVITATVVKANNEGHEIAHFSVHDLRRTASTLLHEAGFNSDWIEKSLAHEQRGVRAVYNKAEYADQRREMLQTWADMIDGWVAGGKVIPIYSARKAHGR